MLKSSVDNYKKMISDGNYMERKIHPFPLDIDLETFLELTIWVYCEKVASSHDYMYSNYHFWKNLTYKNWFDLFHKFIVVHKQGGSAFGIVCFMEFFYEFLKIDFIRVYAETDMLDEKMKHWILEDFVNRPGVLYLRKEDHTKQLQKYSLTFDSLFAIGDNLILQGAYEAEMINPKYHTYFQGSVELFKVQGPTPRSWKWVQKYKK